ncbi:unnamed protein product [Nezara viridula]|uniref:Exonuclease domain-containing protein n=1 Tax=Nezara viridula TaxID=85310 RepID=A0A9P0H9Y3_NEZVI|nr:unnamed protein product [Nezara viridula]
MLEHNKRNLKKLRRKENKKKKLKAFLEISSLNDQDRKKSSVNSANGGLPLKEPSSKKFQKNFEEPNPKRMKRDYLFPLNGIAADDNNDVHTRQDRSLLSEEQISELNKLLKMRKKIRHERPFLELNEVGEAATLSLPESQRVPLPFDDFQHFIITSLFAHMGTKGPSRWINCKKYQKLERRIFLIIEGAGLKDYLENVADLKTLSQFEKQLEVLSPLQYGGDLISELALVSLTNSQRQKLASEYGSLKEAYSSGDIFKTFRTIFPITDRSDKVAEDNQNKDIRLANSESPMLEKVRPKDKFSRKSLLLSPWEMIEENYPMPLNGELGKRYSDFIFTRHDYNEVTENSPMWAIDCEMCLTAAGQELTRICIVDEDLNIVYETLVKPYNPIKNYVTKFSGITPSMMKNVKTRLEDVQADIRAIFPPDVILIGQSLNSDLMAMKMMHPFVIDTSVIFNMSGIRQKKTKLRILVEEFLSLKIQTDDAVGHSPVEDAIAAMKLVQAKLEHSPNWGNVILGGQRSKEESNAARILLETREAAGMARISVADHTRIVWPQLKKDRDCQNHEIHSSGKDVRSDTQHLENIGATSLFSHLVRYDKNALLVAKKNELDKFAPFTGNINNRFRMEAVDTNRAAIKHVREFTETDGTGIAYVSLSSHSPEKAIAKADKLVSKLLKCTKGNTLYTVLLAGHAAKPSDGIIFLHLSRERIPMISNIF